MFSVEKVNGYDARKKELADIAMTPGYRSILMERIRKRIKKTRMDEAMFRINYLGKKGIITFAGNELDVSLAGEPDDVKSKKVDLDFPLDYVHQELLSDSLRGSLPGNKVIGNLVVPTGTCLLIAGGDAGKSPLARALAGTNTKDGTFGTVRIGEPFVGYENDPALVARELARALYSCTDVVVDSIKDMVSSGKGALMSSGISRTTFTEISIWSKIAASVGSTMYIPLNASFKNNEIDDLVREASKSNASMIVYPKSGNEWEFLARTGEGLMRRKGVIEMDYDTMQVSIRQTSDDFAYTGDSIVTASKLFDSSDVRVDIEVNVDLKDAAVRRAILREAK